MENSKKKEELQSRREFFKSAAVDTALQGVLALARVAAKLHVPIVVTIVKYKNRELNKIFSPNMRINANLNHDKTIDTKQ